MDSQVRPYTPLGLAASLSRSLPSQMLLMYAFVSLTGYLILEYCTTLHCTTTLLRYTPCCFNVFCLYFVPLAISTRNLYPESLSLVHLPVLLCRGYHTHTRFRRNHPPIIFDLWFDVSIVMPLYDLVYFYMHTYLCLFS